MDRLVARHSEEREEAAPAEDVELAESALTILRSSYLDRVAISGPYGPTGCSVVAHLR
ncbi:hypothetical protein ABZ721_01070 [Streptomyces sp. NPDC006733]|uniref:hypothetical protein n=1 Tax=Streptomyces sp. NPDC006733 TaxID=3155460 RepID=UPI0033E53C54